MKESGRVSEILQEKKENISSRKQKADFSQPSGSPADSIMFLQRTIGNQAVERLIKSGTLQAKLRIGHIQPKCPKCEEDEEIQRKPHPELEANINAISSGGQPLPDSVRAFFEPRFGIDFSHVRLHTDGSTEAIGALAYTIGDHIVFGKSQYSPNTIDGKRLLAHELAHVIQQRSAPSTIQFKSFGESDDPLEAEADRISENVLEGHRVNVGLTAPAKKPQFGIIGCMWYMWRFSKLLDECRNEYDKACSEDMLSDKCQDFMDGAGFPSDAILKCVGRKNPKAMAKLLSSCSTVSLGQILKGPRAGIERPSGPPPEEVGEDKEPETSVA